MRRRMEWSDTPLGAAAGFGREPPRGGPAASASASACAMAATFWTRLRWRRSFSSDSSYCVGERQEDAPQAPAWDTRTRLDGTQEVLFGGRASLERVLVVSPGGDDAPDFGAREQAAPQEVLEVGDALLQKVLHCVRHFDARYARSCDERSKFSRVEKRMPIFQEIVAK